MAVTYSIDVARKRIEITARGALSFADAVQLQAEIATHPYFHRDLDLLIDCEWLTAVEIDGTQMRDLITSTPFAADNRRALISGTRPLSIGIARMYDSLSDDRFSNVRLFKQKAEAVQWLDSVAASAPPSV